MSKIWYKNSDTWKQVSSDYSKNYYNPNLLMNGNFRINQKDFSEYSTTTTGKMITVDRWYMINKGLSLIISKPSAVGINYSTSGSSGKSYLQQVFENYYYPDQSLLGSLNLSITISASNIKGTAKYQILTEGGYINGDNLQNGIYIKTINISSIIAGLRLEFSPGSYGTINYIKLEFGEPTPYIFEEKGSELLRCRRYLYVMNSFTYYLNYGTFFMYEDNINLVPMYPWPDLLTPYPRIQFIGNSIVLFAILGRPNIEITEFPELVANGLYFTFKNTTGYPQGTSGLFQLTPGSKFILSCDIYTEFPY